LRELSLPSLVREEGEGEETLETIEDATPHWTTQAAAHIFAPMKQYLVNDYEDKEEVLVANEGTDSIENRDRVPKKSKAEVPIMKIAKVKRKKYIRGDIRYVFRKTCSVFGVRPRGVFRRL
jgi:hypothetical protein